jgi:N,N'-diacetyllegionaminate synthase
MVARDEGPIVKTLIIAEAGVNHNGDIALAHQLVDAAADAGADMVKFQTFRAEKLATSQATKAEYQGRTTEAGESQQDMLRRLELTREMHEDLLAHCRSRGIEFFSTGFDETSFDLLVELGLQHFKISSGDVTNLPYLRHVGRHSKPLILSTGMATLLEIKDALEALEQAGTPRELITVLHCNTEYPTPMTDVNLRAMVTIGAEFGVAIGYSDHTLGTEVPIAAAALGATVIEKHLTLDRRLPGPDHQTSLEPKEFKSMVLAIRNIDRALGDGVKRPSPSEKKNISVVRKSIVAACAIRQGEVFSKDNLTVKRPGTGLSPMLWDAVLGRKASRDFAPDDLIVL